MTLSLVSLLAANVDQAASDLADHLTAAGVEAAFESGPYSRRSELAASGGADILWLCGWQALQFTRLELVAAPTFEGERPSSYRSFIVSRTPAAGLEALIADDALWASNEATSWSGHRALRAECDLRGLTAPSRIVWSGSHAESIRMVGEGSADAAAIDSTVWRWEEPADLFVVDVTRPWPAPPILVQDRPDRDTDRLARLILGANGLRGVEALTVADWSHLDPMRGWTGP